MTRKLMWILGIILCKCSYFLKKAAIFIILLFLIQLVFHISLTSTGVISDTSDKIVDKIIIKLNKLNVFDSDSNDSFKEQFFEKIKRAINLDRFQVKIEDKLGEVKSMLETEIRIFTYSIVALAISGVVGSISCLIICIIVIVHKCQERPKSYSSYGMKKSSIVKFNKDQAEQLNLYT
jgi:hypothetical protein